MRYFSFILIAINIVLFIIDIAGSKPEGEYQQNVSYSTTISGQESSQYLLSTQVPTLSGRIYYYDGSGTISRCDFDTDVTKHFEAIHGQLPYVSLDGNYFVFNSNDGGDHDIYLYEVITGKIEKLTDLNGDELCPSISRDNRYVVFQYKSPGEDRDLYLYDCKNRSCYQLTDNELEDRSGCFDPFGNIYYCQEDGEQSYIYILSVSTGECKRATNGNRDYTPNVSPDGNYLTFCRNEDGKQSLWVENLKTYEYNRIYEYSSDINWPCFSPDGKWIAFYLKVDPIIQDNYPGLNQMQICVISCNGGTPYLIKQDVSEDNKRPTWSIY